MKIELETLSTKKFLLITLTSIPLIIISCIGLAILFHTKGIVLVMLPMFGLIVYLGHRFSRTLTIIDLTNPNQLKLDDIEIPYDSILGYYRNDLGLTQITLCLRLNSNKTIQITGSSVGKKGEDFRIKREVILQTLINKNPEVIALEYQDVNVWQPNILRLILYVLTGIIILTDVIAIYYILFENMNLTWKLFLVNSLFIGMVPYMKQRKTTDSNKRR